MLHIAINGFFWDKPTVGVGQYLHGLLNAITHVDAVHIELLVPADTTPPVAPAGVTLHALTTPFDGTSANLAKLWFEQIAVPQAAARLGVQLLHVPYFAPPYSSRVPVVTTIPDLIPLTRPAYRGSALVRGYMALVKAASQRSHTLLAISHAVAHSASQLLHKPLKHIIVTHLAADPMYTPRTDAVAYVAERGIIGPYIYYVGGYDERKNVMTLIRAFAALPDHIRTHTWLVLAGKVPSHNRTLFPDIDAEIDRLGIRAQVKQLDVSRNENPYFYSAATIFVYPSLLEGFGLPPLEALACGTPVICSNQSSLPEVVGDAAIVVDPTQPQAWSDALAQLLQDPNQRSSLRAAGLKRAQRFDYTHTAQTTVDAYRAVVEPSGIQR
jgi:glycosyltransferase involved in cell wall biosynthesis